MVTTLLHARVLCSPVEEITLEVVTLVVMIWVVVIQDVMMEYCSMLYSVHQDTKSCTIPPTINEYRILEQTCA